VAFSRAASGCSGVSDRKVARDEEATDVREMSLALLDDMGKNKDVGGQHQGFSSKRKEERG